MSACKEKAFHIRLFMCERPFQGGIQTVRRSDSVVAGAVVMLRSFLSTVMRVII